MFCAALLNAQPMGFYAPAQIVRDAQVHGVEVRPVCVNASRWNCTLEPVRTDEDGMDEAEAREHDGRFAVWLGLRMVKGLANARADRPFVSVDDCWRRAGVPVAALVRIAEADGFRPSLHLAWREALWAIRALRDEPLPLFSCARLLAG